MFDEGIDNDSRPGFDSLHLHRGAFGFSRSLSIQQRDPGADWQVSPGGGEQVSMGLDGDVGEHRQATTATKPAICVRLIKRKTIIAKSNGLQLAMAA